MFSRIAYIARQDSNEQKIRNLLGDLRRFELREFQSMVDIQAGLDKYPFDLLMVRFPVLLESSLTNIHKMRQRFPNTPLLTLAPTIDPRIRYLTRGLLYHRFVEDIELGDLPNLIETVRGQHSPSAGRMHPRTERRSNLELVNSETGERLNAEFLDFAQMGARIVLHSRKKLGLKSKWQVHYPSTSEPGKTQRLETIVVWEGAEAATQLSSLLTGPRTVIGVRFVASL